MTTKDELLRAVIQEMLRLDVARESTEYGLTWSARNCSGGIDHGSKLLALYLALRQL